MSRRTQRLLVSLLVAIVIAGVGMWNEWQQQQHVAQTVAQVPSSETLATTALAQLPIKGRAPKTDYSRQQFGGDWADAGGCDMREKILGRDLVHVVLQSVTDCTVLSGTLHDPYTGKTINFVRGPSTSSQVQIDHVVAIGDAWQKGAQQLTYTQRVQLYNDPLELLAVDGNANQQKSDGDAATWLPPNKSYRCRYVARQVAVKVKYHLWVTQAEYNAIATILASCPAQVLPVSTQ